MPWQDRLKEPAITTPDGLRYVFQYTDFEKTQNKKTSSYVFADTKGAKVDDFGPGELDIPLTIYFSGPEYDLAAALFDISIAQSGVCVLEHPMYGIKNVNVLNIKRRDAVRSAGGQAIFTLEMRETILDTLPVSDEEARQAIFGKMEELLDSNSTAFAESDTSFFADAIAAKNRVTAFTKDLKDGFKEILNKVQAVQDAFNEIEDYINSNIDFLLASPLLLAASLQRLINSPARIASSVGSRISAYLDSYNKMFGTTQGTGTTDVKNQRLEKQLLLVGIVSAIAQANLFSDSDGVGFLTKSEALQNADSLITLLVDNQDFLDTEEQASLADNLEKRFVVNDVVSQQIKNIVSLTTKNLIRLSFSLKQERIIFLDKKRDIITLCYELYGTTNNDTLDFFVDTNVLTGDELLEIPIGREIRYYV